MFPSEPTESPVLPLAFLGGSFDPLHHGHLLIARTAHAQLGAEWVGLIPAAVSPFKVGQPPRATPQQRLEMLRLATSGDARLRVLDLELQRPPPSYTVDTAKALRERFPGRPLWWILGADQFAALPRWHRAPELAGWVGFAVAARPGHALQPPALPGLRWRALDAPLCEVSSSALRARAAAGLPLDSFAPPTVVNYVHQAGLYQHQA